MPRRAFHYFVNAESKKRNQINEITTKHKIYFDNSVASRKILYPTAD